MATIFFLFSTHFSTHFSTQFSTTLILGTNENNIYLYFAVKYDKTCTNKNLWSFRVKHRQVRNRGIPLSLCKDIKFIGSLSRLPLTRKPRRSKGFVIDLLESLCFLPKKYPPFWVDFLAQRERFELSERY